MRTTIVTLLAGLALAGCASSQSTGTGPEVAGGSGSPTTGNVSATAPTRSGPGTGGTASGTPSQVIGVTALCPVGLDIDQPADPRPMKLPSTLSVAWVLRCTIVSKPGAAKMLVSERSTGDLGPLLKALQTPSTPRSKGVCPMFRVPLPYFALVLTDGRTLRPPVPANSCGQQQPAVLAALNALRFIVISSRPLP
jgi:hypothetical protein